MMRPVRFSIFCLLALILESTSLVLAAEGPSTRPAEPNNGWDSHWFNYEASTVIVEETTPTPEQIDFQNRPPVMSVAAEPTTNAPAAPLAIGPVDVLHLRFRDHRGEDVPVLLCKPRGKTGPFPVVIAVHGVCSNKAQVCGMLMAGLARRGFAILAPDLPLHGERPGDPRQLMEAPDLPRVVGLCRQAIVDIRQCIDLAEHRTDLDTRRGVILAGYSLGAIIDSVAGPADERVKAMLLMAGGVPDVPSAFLAIPGVSSLTPQQAIPHFAGRPLLMLNGSQDEAVRPDWAQRLFAAARDPKEQKWYDAGHDLPPRACDEGTEWIAATWKTLRTDTAR